MMEWAELGACVGHPRDWWFPTRDSDRKDTTRALHICSRCPVKDECGAHAEALNEQGIWGGVNRGASRHVLPARPCDWCGGLFNPQHNGPAPARYCSPVCRSEGRRRTHRASYARVQGG